MALRSSTSKTAGWPASTSDENSGIEATYGPAATVVDVHAVQCCGVLRWQARSWCENGTTRRKSTYKPALKAAQRRRRRSAGLALIPHHDTPCRRHAARQRILMSGAAG